MDLSHEKWFSEKSLSDKELQEIDTHAFQLVIPPSHPILRRLRMTIAGEESILGALSTVARLTLPLENSAVVLDLLETASKSIERQMSKMNEQILRLCDSYLLECLILATSAHNETISASDALILLNNSVKRCTGACASVLRSVIAYGPAEATGRSLRLVPAIVRILHELVSYKAFWSRRGRESSDKSMPDLSKGFEKYIGDINEVVLHDEVLDLMSLVMHRWCCDVVLEPLDATAFRYFSIFERTLASVLGFVTNILTFTSSFTIAIRKHLSTQTVLLHNVVLPLTLFLLDADERHVFPDCSKTVCALLRTLSLVMFNVRVFRPWLSRTPDIVERICRYASHVCDDATSVDIAAATTRLVVNAEISEGVKPLLLFAAQLDERRQRDLARKLSNPRERSAPTQIFCDTYLSLRSVFALKEAADHISETVISKKTIQRRKKNRRRRERNQIRYRALQANLQVNVSEEQSFVKVEGEENDAECEVEDDSDSDMDAAEEGGTPAAQPDAVTPLPVEVPVEAVVDLLTKYRSLPPPPPSTPGRYRCALTGQVIQVPVLSPYGDVFDKASILGYLKDNGCKCPITQQELYSTDLVVDQGLKRELDVVRFNYC
jgi:hypothetical protein